MSPAELLDELSRVVDDDDRVAEVERDDVRACAEAAAAPARRVRLAGHELVTTPSPLELERAPATTPLPPCFDEAGGSDLPPPSDRA